MSVKPQPTKFYYKAVIQYNGTGYAGFQWQKDAATIQSEFNSSLAKLVVGQLTSQGASRTDTGVHAMEQVVRVTASSPFEFNLEDINRVLPKQIKCIEIGPCAREFKPTASSAKEYHYYFTNLKNTAPDANRFVVNFPLTLDIACMQECARAIVGTHNFHNFYSTGSNVSTTTREIFQCELELVDPRDDLAGSELFVTNLTSCYRLRIVGGGFLKQMVRHLMSALWMVGSGKLSTAEFLNLLHGPKRDKRLWKVAAPNGLFLFRLKIH